MLERTGLTRPDEDRCAFLRWKGIYIGVEWDTSVQYSNDRAFWCQKTQVCLGPDSKLVDDYECHEGRNCFQAL